MGQILGLAIISAFFPTLLAGVVVILTRPHPARLLVGFWIGGLATSLTSGFLLLSAFNDHQSVAGTTKDTISPALYFLTAVTAFGVGALIGTHRGRELLGRRPKRRKPKDPDKKPWSERVLEEGTMPVAIGVGAVINLPGPFYIVALGILAGEHNAVAADAIVIIAFNLIMFTLVEVPLIGYVVRPERTAALVHRGSNWLHENGLKIMTVIVLIVGVVSTVKGIDGLK
jgi:Sap, sulfolipid-1-addressing protein